MKDDDPTAPTCGRCGYCVRGISGMICPECGANLIEVGIIIGRLRRFKSRTSQILIWIVGLPILAALVSWLLLLTVLPFSLMQNVDRGIKIQSPSLNTTIDVWGAKRLWQPALMKRPVASPENLAVEYRRINRSFLKVNVRTGQFNYYDPSDRAGWRTQTGFGSKALVDRFVVLGANPADPEVQNISNQLLSIITHMSQGIDLGKTIPLNDLSGRQIGVAQPALSWVVHDEPHPAVIVALSVCCLGVWIYGIRRAFGGPESAHNKLSR